MKVSDKPRIAILVPGGIGTGKFNIGIPVLQSIIKLLSDQFQITVFQFHPVNPGYRPDGFEIQVIQSRLFFPRFLIFFFHFWRRHRVQRFLVIHGFLAWSPGFLAVVMARIFNIKSVVSLLGSDTISLPSIQYGQLRSPLRKKIIFWTLRYADVNISLTKYMIDLLGKEGLKGENFNVIPWGVDQDVFHFVSKPLNNPIRFLHIGNLALIKDQHTLLRAFRGILDKVSSVLTIIGQGPMESDIRKWIIEMGLQHSVTILPQQPYESLPSFYHDADVLLHTSLSEGQSEVVTEAMSCGVLVCGTRVGLLNDYPASCVTTEPGDHAELAAKTLEVLLEQSKVHRLVATGNNWAKAHDIHWTVEKIGEIYLP